MPDNHFRAFAGRGFTRLVPIIPPDAPISEHSSLNRAVGKHNDPRGKAVGIKRNGEWSGFNWVVYEADEHDYDRWSSMGAGVGIKTGQGLVAIDADTKIEDHARTILETVEKHFGRLHIRIGRPPKALYLIRTDPDYRYTRVDFGDRDERGNLPNRVEILAEGRQFVAHGIHPGTKKPYSWPRGIPDLNDIPYATPEALDAFMAELTQILPKAQDATKEGASASINQAALKGDPKTIEAAVRATPNSSKLFPTRESYRDFGYAIKAALPDNEPLAFELWADWCDRWDDGTNDPDVIASDWKRMKGPYRVGAGKVYELAEATSEGRFTIAQAWFDDLSTVPENPFDAIRDKEVRTDTFPLVTVHDLVNRPPPTFLIDRHIVEKSVGFIYSEPGIGKTFIALDMALSIAAGLEQWHGDPIGAKDGAAVVYIASEGSYGFRNRIKAWMKERGVPEIGLNRFYMIEQTINFMEREDIEKLLRTVRGVSGIALSLVVVDTVSRAIPGADENLQKDMSLFVSACDRVRDAFGCAVLGVHHAGKSGDMRGSTVLRGAGDFVFRLERKKGVSVGRLECEKMKDAPDGWADQYSFGVVDLDDGQTSLVVGRLEMGGVGPGATVTPSATAAVLAAMAAAWDAGEPWCRTPRCKPAERYAVRRMVTDFGFDGATAEQTLTVWESMGVIAHETRDRKNGKTGYKVGVDPGQFVQNTGLFD